MPSNFQTTVPIFLLIVIGYIALSLFLGAKKAYFEPWEANSEDPEEKSPSQGDHETVLKQGASPWKVGESSEEKPPSES